MSKRSVWQDGRRAWERIRGWHLSSPAGEGRPRVAKAQRALIDVRRVRSLLDVTEMNAVRAARQAGASWTTDVATMLGVSRQSAWERWREIDEPRTVAGGGR